MHSLVLCEGDAASNGLEELYVFGSNYFGQLGTGQTAEPGEEKGMSKAMVPIRLELNERIRCIHTRFFVNVSESFLCHDNKSRELRSIDISDKYIILQN